MVGRALIKPIIWAPDEAVFIDLALGVGSGGHANGDILVEIEDVQGSLFSDVLTGSFGTNVLLGRAGNDVISGGLSNDQLEGGIGNDTLSGDAGADIVDGGDGRDAASYLGSAVAVEVDLTTGLVHRW